MGLSKGTLLNVLWTLGIYRPQEESDGLQCINGLSLSVLHLGSCVLDAVPPNQISKIENVSINFPSRTAVITSVK